MKHLFGEDGNTLHPHQVHLMLLLMVLSVISAIPAFATWTIIDGEYTNPVTGSWIGGDGNGVLTSSRDTDIFKNGAASIKWSYTFGATTLGNWPTIEILNGNKNWTGATSLGVWMYYDLTSTKYNWTIEPALMHPFPTDDVLGNWNSDPTGVPNNTWVWHE